MNEPLNPYDPPRNVEVSPVVSPEPERIASYDDMMQYAKKHKRSSLLCNFLTKLDAQAPEAVIDFLERFLQKDQPTSSLQYFLRRSTQLAYPVITLQNYNLEISESPNVSRIIYINEPNLFRESVNECNHRRISRRRFLNSSVGIGIVATALFAGTGKAFEMQADDTKNLEDKKHNQIISTVAYGAAAISAILMLIAASAHRKQPINIDPETTPTVKDFEKFVAAADTELLNIARNLPQEKSR